MMFFGLSVIWFSDQIDFPSLGHCKIIKCLMEINVFKYNKKEVNIEHSWRKQIKQRQKE